MGIKSIIRPLMLRGFIRSAWRTQLATSIIPILGTFAKLRKATVNFVMSVCLTVSQSAWKNWAPAGRIFMQFDICFPKNMTRKFQFHENLKRINNALHEDQGAFTGCC